MKSKEITNEVFVCKKKVCKGRNALLSNKSKWWSVGAAAMAQWLRVLAGLAGAPSSVPSTHFLLTAAWNSSSYRGLDPFLASKGHPHACGMHTQGQINVTKRGK